VKLRILLAAALFFAFFAHGYVENTDAQVTLHAARAWWLRGDPGLEVERPDSWPAERVIAGLIARGPDFGMTGRNGKQYVWYPIGHQALLVPCVALGEVAGRLWPRPAQALLLRNGDVFGDLFWAQFFASFVPALAAAGSALFLFLIARTLGCTPRESGLVLLASTLCTQFWPGASETMSDPPGLCCLLAFAWLVIRHVAGPDRPRALLWAGLAGGAAVLLRYPHAGPVAILAAGPLFDAWRRRDVRPVAWLGLGAAPCLLALLAANWLRFRSLFETGYSAGANAQWFNYPLFLGVPLILLAPGKGLLWFSPPVWLALGACRRRASWRWPLLAAALAFLLPVLVFGRTSGWAAGQCWGIRYLTPGVVLLVVVAFALRRPWRTRPRLFAGLCLLGFLFSLGGVLAPYRGQQERAIAAAGRLYPESKPENRPDHANVDPRLSPLHMHWTYAWQAARGRLDPPPSWREDSGFRHLWIPYVADLLGFAAWPFVLLWLGLTGLAVRAAWRAVLKSGG
jgi:hypothetical protein